MPSGAPASALAGSQPSRSVASMINMSDGSMAATLAGSSSAITMLPGSAPGAGERVDPSDHARACVLDVLPAEEVLRLDPIDRIDRTQEVALVAERYRGIDAHAALEIGIRGRPLLLPRGHAFGRHEGLTAAARNRVEDVGARIHPRGEAPHYVVHRVRIDILAYRDCKPHALRAGERRGEEVALPAFIDLVA